MRQIVVQGFQGMKPMLSDLLLSRNEAKYALNCDFLSGSIRPLKQNKHVINNDVVAGNNNTNRPKATQKGFIPLANGKYKFTDDATPYVEVKQTKESDSRTLFIANGETKQTSNDGTKDLKFAHFGQMHESSVVLDLEKATGEKESDSPKWFYAYSIINEYADESGLSTATHITVNADGTVNIEIDNNGMAVLKTFLTNNYGTLEGLKIRIYRSLVGVYQLVHTSELTIPDITKFTYTDTLATPGSKTFDWAAEDVHLPSGIKGMLYHDNNFLIAYDNHNIYFSDPNNIAQFPESLRIKINNKKIVSLVEFLNRIIVFYQDQQHDVLNITLPTKQDLGQLDSPESAFHCSSGDSVINVGNGIVFASREGLCITNGYETNLLDPKLFDATSFAQYDPSSIKIFAGDHEFIMVANNIETFYFKRDMQMVALSETVEEAKWINGKWIMLTKDRTNNTRVLEEGFKSDVNRSYVWEGGELTMSHPTTIRNAFCYGKYQNEATTFIGGLGTNILGATLDGLGTSTYEKIKSTFSDFVNLQVTMDDVDYKLPNPFRNNQPSGFRAAVGRKFRRYKFKVSGTAEISQIALTTKEVILDQVAYPA